MREAGPSDVAMRLVNVSKRFELDRAKQRSLMELFTRPFRRSEPREYFWPLRDVSFGLTRGTTLGIIGENGAGKSTALKLMARILEPTSGCVETYGRLAALLELGAGFHSDLTGRENVYLNGSIMGLNRREVSRHLDQIIEFADIGPFIDVPVKHYSSGMRVRLGFSVAVHVQPDIMLVDEVLAVGDEDFQHKCLQAFYDFVQRGGTLILVSHNVGLIRDMCRRTIWLDDGRIQADGPSSEVLASYLSHVHDKERERLTTERAVAQTVSAQAQGKTPKKRRESSVSIENAPEAPLSDAQEAGQRVGEAQRWGDKAICIDAVRVLNQGGVSSGLLLTGAPFTIEFDYAVHRPLTEPPVIGVAFVRHDGLWCYGTNTQIEGVSPGDILQPGHRQGTVAVSFDALHLLSGDYSIDLALQSPRGGDYDYYRGCARLTVRSATADTGVARMTHKWHFRKRASD